MPCQRKELTPLEISARAADEANRIAVKQMFRDRIVADGLNMQQVRALGIMEIRSWIPKLQHQIIPEGMFLEWRDSYARKMQRAIMAPKIQIVGDAIKAEFPNATINYRDIQTLIVRLLG